MSLSTNMLKPNKHLQEPIDFLAFITISSANMALVDGGIRGFYGKNGRLVCYDFRTEEIARVDARLPGVLQERFRQQNDPEAVLPVAWVQNTLDYWTSRIDLQTTSSRTYAIASVESVTELYDTAQEAKIGVIKYAESWDNDVYFATGTKWLECFVSYTELEKHFPGWRVRYDLMVSLADNPVELRNSVFQRPNASPSPPVKVSMDNIDFE